jgi:predicted metal-dependent hydrolase
MGKTISCDKICFGTTEIEYTIQRSSRRKTLAISVCGPLVEVTAPAGMRTAAIRPYVKGKGGWIVRKLDGNRSHGIPYPKRLIAGESIRFLGRQYLLRVRISDANAPRLVFDHGTFILDISDDSKEETGKRLFKTWYRKELEKRLPAILAIYAKRLRICLPPFRIRDLGNRWGSCSKDGTINFHWMLATQSAEFIEKVVAHEICHLLEPSHSKKFFHILRIIHPSRG